MRNTVLDFIGILLFGIGFMTTIIAGGIAILKYLPVELFIIYVGLLLICLDKVFIKANKGLI